MRVLLAPALIAALALAGCMDEGRDTRSAVTQAGLDKALAGLVPGSTTSCLPPGYSSSTSKVYGKVLLYSRTSGDVYRNDTTGGCEGGGDDVLVINEPEGRACSGDIVRTVDRSSHFMTGSCALGQFTHYSRPKAGPNT